MMRKENRKQKKTTQVPLSYKSLVSRFLWQSTQQTIFRVLSQVPPPFLPPLPDPHTPKRPMMSSLFRRGRRKGRNTRRMLMNPRGVKTGRVWSVVVPGTILFRSSLLWLDNLVCDEVLGVCLQERERERRKMRRVKSGRTEADTNVISS